MEPELPPSLLKLQLGAENKSEEKPKNENKKEKEKTKKPSFGDATTAAEAEDQEEDEEEEDEEEEVPPPPPPPALEKLHILEVNGTSSGLGPDIDHQDNIYLAELVVAKMSKIYCH